MSAARVIGLTAAPVLVFTLSASAQAVRVDTISPAMAKPGDQVAITGIGLGGQSVRIMVGRVPARVVTAFGDRATFIVPGSLPTERP